MNHDALFKMLLKRPGHSSSFLRSLSARYSRFVDFHSSSSIDKERYTIEGKKRTGDLPPQNPVQHEPAGFTDTPRAPGPARFELRPAHARILRARLARVRLPVYPIAVLSHKTLRPSGRRRLPLIFRTRESSCSISMYRSGAPRRLGLCSTAESGRTRVGIPDEVRRPRPRAPDAGFFFSLAATDLQQKEQRAGHWILFRLPSSTEQEVLQLETE